MGHAVVLTPKGERWRRSRHPWIYQDDLQAGESGLSGRIVQVKSPRGQPLGQAFYNAKSKIALRWLTDDPEIPIDKGFWEKRLLAAIEYRRRIAAGASAFRLIHSEADGFPGLIVDRYGPVVVLQSLSLGVEQILPLLTELILQHLAPEALVARNDSQVRILEGLPSEKKLLAGSSPGLVEVKEGERRYGVDVWEGHKTGAYLDQRENRLWAGELVRGRVLDAFAYQGGFSLQAAARAGEVLAIEDSAQAVTRLGENLKLNGITNVRVAKENAFEALRRLDKLGERFDAVILDPPAFAKAKAELAGAVRGYREINLRALKLLNPGGVLISCSCSYQVSQELFVEILREACADSGREVRLREIRSQARDHPVVLTHPESRYLKCVALEVV
ncbi:MAG: class I SAM-dependent rRNA methyltransferase [Candidatus Omnitrophica bacterium]|nr:class I SAM-dependent rRNA methyltransferase [Candidatus Omnitrophota bacterium]